MSPIIVQFEKLLADGKDNALLRYSLGNEYLKAGEIAKAIAHLKHALTLDPHYSAAWKLLGKALTEANQLSEALQIYQQGIAVAEGKGDKQAAKEMTVFANRIKKNEGA